MVATFPLTVAGRFESQEIAVSRGERLSWNWARLRATPACIAGLFYPPADKTLIWSAEECRRLERCGFRPLVVAYNEPRFLFDFHSAGGLLGHLYIGLSTAGSSKWFHQWSDLNVRYVGGGMEYTIRDNSFPGLVVSLTALPLADSAGVIVRIPVAGSREPARLVWA